MNFLAYDGFIRYNFIVSWGASVCKHIHVYMYMHPYLYCEEERERFILKNWFMWLWWLACSLVAEQEAAWRQVNLMLQTWVQRQSEGEFLPSQGMSVFSFPPATLLKAFPLNQMMPIHVMEGNLLYSKSTDWNVDCILKSSCGATSTLVFNQTSGHESLAQLAQKVNHHSWFSWADSFSVRAQEHTRVFQRQIILLCR